MIDCVDGVSSTKRVNVAAFPPASRGGSRKGVLLILLPRGVTGSSAGNLLLTVLLGNLGLAFQPPKTAYHNV
jgi:hypothetical protein